MKKNIMSPRTTLLHSQMKLFFRITSIRPGFKGGVKVPETHNRDDKKVCFRKNFGQNSLL